MPQHSPLIEPLESRRLLALTAGTVSATVFYDRDRNGKLDANESALANWPVTASLLTSASGARATRVGTTDPDGRITFVDYYDPSLGERPSARISLALNTRYRSTNQKRDSSGNTYANAQPGALFAMTDVGAVTGNVTNLFPLTTSAADRARAPLVDRIVFDDTNRNGRRDSDESFTRTDLAGDYTLNLRTGSHVLRLDPGIDFAPANGGKFVQSMTVKTGAVSPPKPRTFFVTLDKPQVIDVLIGYTSSAADFASGTIGTSITSYIREMMTTANEVFANSQTNVRLRLAAQSAVNYAESGDLAKDLPRLQDGNDGYLDELAAARGPDKADVVVLLTDAGKVKDDTIGLAYEYSKSDPNRDESADAVVALYRESEDAFTLAHEIGHILGAGHDSDNSRGEDVPARYSHGYRFTGNDGVTYKDVMAYDPGKTLPFFSTPLFSYAGEPLGLASAADNARVIRELAPDVARYR